MAQNLVSLNLTPAEITKLNTALNTIDGIFKDRATSRTPAQRRTLIKMGDKSRNFLRASRRRPAKQRHQPARRFPMADLAQDVADYTALDTLYTR